MNEHKSCRIRSAYILAGEGILAPRAAGVTLFHPLISCSKNSRSGSLRGNCVGLVAAARLSILSTQSRNFAIDLGSLPAALAANCMVVACFPLFRSSAGDLECVHRSTKFSPAVAVSQQ